MLKSSPSKVEKQFLISELDEKMNGLVKVRKCYLLEEIAGKPFCMRVSFFTATENENECRTAIKQLTQLRTYLEQADHRALKGSKIVGSYSEIYIKDKYKDIQHEGLDGLDEVDSEDLSMSEQEANGEVADETVRVEEAENQPSNLMAELAQNDTSTVL